MHGYEYTLHVLQNLKVREGLTSKEVARHNAHVWLCTYCSHFSILHGVDAAAFLCELDKLWSIPV